MGLIDKLRGQFSAVIEWKHPSSNVLWYKYPNANDEIINAGKLIVAPGQGAVLVYEGKIADVLEEEGIFNLKTDNHPFFTKLIKLRQGFESEHKLYIYFFRRAQIVNQGWGTASPVKFMDTVYKVPVELGLNGTFSYAMADVRTFYTEIVGSRDSFDTEAMRATLLDRITQNIVSVIHQKGYPYTEIDAHLTEIGEELKKLLADDYSQLGLRITDFRVNGTQFDEETQERIRRVSDVVADTYAAQQAGLDYVGLEKLRALRDAARNEGGLAGSGLQMGVGLELGKQMGGLTAAALQDSAATPAAAASAPAEKGEENDVVARLRRLKALLDEGIITPEDYETKKTALLGEL